ncbi:hypothetical protein VNO78_12032 [Psophocarpus tetragonolobus]|uniref:Cytochrome P450 n=1 Tax=Psophocarpus tetragonolobus TaxID=3891 RepID=A0AAN9SMB8_PSOTE
MMETLLLIVASLVCALIRAIFSPQKKTFNTPLGPLHVPIISNILWLRKTFQLETILRKLHAKHGHMVTLHIGTLPAIFIADRALVHQGPHPKRHRFLRPPRVLRQRTTPHQLHRRNFASEMLHPSRVKQRRHFGSAYKSQEGEEAERRQ